MRPGYLANLAARTLGVAPVLRPATPSRFEPEGPQPELREITEVRGAEPPPQRAHETAASASLLARDGWPSDVSKPVSQQTQSAERTPPAAPALVRASTEAFPAADRPLPGFFAADIAAERTTAQPALDGWAAPGLGGPASEPAATGGPVPADAVVPARDAAGPGRPRPDQAAEAMLPRDRRTPWPEHMVQTSRSRQQAQPPGRAADGAEAAEASGTEPAIVVRIGRVDVRAVQAAPPPAPAPRPRPAAGPSLAEHLAARDGRRR